MISPKASAGSIHKFKQLAKGLQFQKHLLFHLFLVLEGHREFMWQRLLPGSVLPSCWRQPQAPLWSVVVLPEAKPTSWEQRCSGPCPGHSHPGSHPSPCPTQCGGLPAPRELRTPRPTVACVQHWPAMPICYRQGEDGAQLRLLTTPGASVPAAPTALMSVDGNPSLSIFKSMLVCCLGYFPQKNCKVSSQISHVEFPPNQFPPQGRGDCLSLWVPEPRAPPASSRAEDRDAPQTHAPEEGHRGGPRPHCALTVTVAPSLKSVCFPPFTHAVRGSLTPANSSSASGPPVPCPRLPVKSALPSRFPCRRLLLTTPLPTLCCLPPSSPF